MDDFDGFLRGTCSQSSESGALCKGEMGSKYDQVPPSIIEIGFLSVVHRSYDEPWTPFIYGKTINVPQGKSAEGLHNDLISGW